MASGFDLVFHLSGAQMNTPMRVWDTIRGPAYIAILVLLLAILGVCLGVSGPIVLTVAGALLIVLTWIACGLVYLEFRDE